MFTKILVQPLFNLLVFIYAILPGHDFGVAIIILTILIRLALWPLVSKQLHSQRAMQQLAPEVAKVKAKAKGDKQAESRMLMELYKEKGVNPFGALGLTLIQLPLLIALFVVLRDIIKAGQIAALTYGGLHGLGQVKIILINSAAFHTTMFGGVNLAKPNVFLAVLAGLAQYVQTKQLMPKEKSNDPSQRAMAMTSTIFPVLTFIIALSLPSALALYWATSSAFAIFQQWWLLKRDVEEMEAKAK